MDEINIKKIPWQPKLRGFSLGLLIMLCVMYQAYFYGISIEKGINGPGWQRSALKLLGLMFFYLSILKAFSLQAMMRNFSLKLPILFFAIVTIFVSPFLGPFELQAINMCFFLPLFAIDFNKFKGEFLFNRFFSILSLILLIQVVLDPGLKFITGIGQDNMALIGGVGNANSFGYMLLCSAIYFFLCSKNRLIFYFLCLASIFTGSLVILIISGSIVFLSVFDNIRKLKFLNLIAICIIVGALFFLLDFFYEENLESFLKGVSHSITKFLSLLSFLEGSQFQSASISIRKEYTDEGLRLISDNPLSLFFGHPEMTALYTGDGWWLALLVSHGLIWTFLFFVCNVLVFLKGFKLRTPEGRCSSFLIFLTCIILVTNRILDYWPAAIVYIFVFAYVCNRNLKVLA